MKKIFTSFLLIVLVHASFAQQKVKVIYHGNDGPQSDSLIKSNYHPDVTLLDTSSVKKQQDTTKAIRIRPDQLVWKDAQPPLTAGAKVAVLEGSPKTDGMFTIRLKLPPHWLLPAHWHPADERVTVLSGNAYVGFGEKMDKTKATKFSAGSFYINPAMSHHYVFTDNEETVIQITAKGPWGLTYIEEKK